MSDDSNSHYRSSDPYGRAPAQANDPLAELARLIGRRPARIRPRPQSPQPRLPACRIDWPHNDPFPYPAPACAAATSRSAKIRNAPRYAGAATQRARTALLRARAAKRSGLRSCARRMTGRFRASQATPPSLRSALTHQAPVAPAELLRRAASYNDGRTCAGRRSPMISPAPCPNRAAAVADLRHAGLRSSGSGAAGFPARAIRRSGRSRSRRSIRTSWKRAACRRRRATNTTMTPRRRAGAKG